jgi:hypothetical protein
MGVTVQANNPPINLSVDSDTATVEIEVSVNQTVVELASVSDVNINNYGGNYYQHLQTIADSSWTFDHLLGRPVTAALVEDSGGNDWACQITNNSISNVTLYIGQAMGGTAKII